MKRPNRQNYDIGTYGDIKYDKAIEKYCSYIENRLLEAETELKKLRVADVIKNEVAVCELKGIGFCQHEEQDGKCNFDGNCINKQTVL